MDSAQPELITICITSYCRPTLLVQSLLSCFSQNYRPLEIDISDDSPTTEVWDAIRLLRAPKGISVRYKRNPVALGEAANVNALFAQARGARLLLLHDDDMLLEGAVSALADAFLCSAKAIASFGRQRIISIEGQVDERASEEANTCFHRTVEQAGILNDPLLSALRRQFPNNGYLIRSEVARKVKYRSVEEIGRAVDTDFGLRVGLAFPESSFVLLPQYTTCYRLTPASSAKQHGVASKLYRWLGTLGNLTPEQHAARVDLQRALAPLALTDHALNRERMEAWRIATSNPYRRQVTLSTAAYQLMLIVAPKVAKLRGAMRDLIR